MEKENKICYIYEWLEITNTRKKNETIIFIWIRDTISTEKSRQFKPVFSIPDKDIIRLTGKEG